MHLEGNDLQRMFQDPFVVWLRERAKDLLHGLDSTQTSPESLSTLLFEGPSAEEDEVSYQA